MDIWSDDISTLVLKRLESSSLKKFSLDGRMLNVLLSLEGRRTLGEISEDLSLDMPTLREVIARLIQLELVAPIDTDPRMLDDEFMAYLTEQFTQAVGPIAPVLIDDILDSMGLHRSTIPSQRAAELIDMMAQESQHEEKRTTFIQSMIRKIVEKGYQHT